MSFGNKVSPVSVQVFEEFVSLVPLALLHRVVESTLAIGPDCSSGSLSVVIANSETVRVLNRRHRGLNEDTDVLAFSFSHQGEYYGNDLTRTEDVQFVMPPETSIGLGEVIISYPQAARQAEESGHTTGRELALLLAHGVLHLLGYDHLDPEEEAIMKAREAEIMAQVIEHE